MKRRILMKTNLKAVIRGAEDKNKRSQRAKVALKGHRPLPTKAVQRKEKTSQPQPRVTSYQTPRASSRPTRS
jgi:hypothetical protein